MKFNTLGIINSVSANFPHIFSASLLEIDVFVVNLSNVLIQFSPFLTGKLKTFIVVSMFYHNSVFLVAGIHSAVSFRTERGLSCVGG